MRKLLPLFLVVLAAAPIGSAGDALPVASTEQVVNRLPQQGDALVALGIAELFQTPQTLTVTATGMQIGEVPPDVLIARVGDDGKTEVVCVNSPEAARAFAARTRTIAPDNQPQDK